MVVREKLTEKWSPQLIARLLTRTHPGDPSMRACPETIYRGLFAGLIGRRNGALGTGRTRRKKQRRGVPSPNKIKNMTLIHQRPAEVNDRKTLRH
ncbi:IS30 family transposase [Streptomyces sp. V4I23]|nr:IS30 family transposase [Streptomyces sp. V4I23]